MAGDDDLLDADDYESEQETEVSDDLDLTPKEKTDARRLVEDRLEELRLKKMMEDFDFDLD